MDALGNDLGFLQSPNFVSVTHVSLARLEILKAYSAVIGATWRRLL